MPDPNLEILKKESYLRMIENSPGTRMFSSFFVRRKDTGATDDVLQDGSYSCAAFTSSVLVLFDFLPRSIATVKSVRNKVTELGWKEITGTPEPGDVVFWAEQKTEDGTMHGHVGFAVGNDEAVSTSAKERQVTRHHLTYGANKDGSPVRPVTTIFRPPYDTTPPRPDNVHHVAIMKKSWGLIPKI